MTQLCKDCEAPLQSEEMDLGLCEECQIVQQVISDMEPEIDRFVDDVIDNYWPLLDDEEDTYYGPQTDS